MLSDGSRTLPTNSIFGNTWGFCRSIRDLLHLHNVDNANLCIANADNEDIFSKRLFYCFLE